VTADFLIRHARLALTCAGPAPRRGPAQREAGPIRDAAIAARGGRIQFVGTTDEWDRLGTTTPGAVVVEVPGCTVVPGFVDPHTHVVFAGDRREELRRRLAGASYAEIAAEGGGILSTVRATRAAGEDRLLAETRSRLDEMLRCGTTTCEAKSGYGLTTDAEVKMLRVVRRLAGSHPIELVPTLLGAHEVPAEYRGNRDGYVALVVDEMIPAVAREGLAEWCDVFCETGVFTPEDSREILQADRRRPQAADSRRRTGRQRRIPPRLGARRTIGRSPHLRRPESASGMPRASVVATLLPIAAFYLKLGASRRQGCSSTGTSRSPWPTDLNPGRGFSPSMPFAITLACFAMQMTLEEALVAATLNAAYALDRHDRVAVSGVSKQMDAVLVDGDAVDLFRVGAQAIRMVIKRGEIVVGTA
jgi:imidazolonepropionase